MAAGLRGSGERVTDPMLTVIPESEQGIPEQVCRMTESWQRLFGQSVEERRLQWRLESIMGAENQS